MRLWRPDKRKRGRGLRPRMGRRGCWEGGRCRGLGGQGGVTLGDKCKLNIRNMQLVLMHNLGVQKVLFDKNLFKISVYTLPGVECKKLMEYCDYR